jgi:AcrR family transcriptional regulator
LFVERGYVATTMESIAERADVAPQTVYHLFGTKSSILGAVLDTSIVGDHDETPLAGRDWFERLESLSTPNDAIALVVGESLPILARVAPVHAVVRHASADPDVDRLYAASRAGRRADHRRLVGMLHRNGILRQTLTLDEAADIFYALVSEDTYLLLVGDCGWDIDRFGSWLVDAVTAALT